MTTTVKKDLRQDFKGQGASVSREGGRRRSRLKLLTQVVEAKIENSPTVGRKRGRCQRHARRRFPSFALGLRRPPWEPVPLNRLLPQFVHGHLPSNGCVGLACVLPPACPPSGPRCGGLPTVLLFLLSSRGDGSGWHSVEDLLTALLRDKRAGEIACRRARRRSKTIKFHWPAIRLTTQPRTVPLV